MRISLLNIMTNKKKDIVIIIFCLLIFISLLIIGIVFQTSLSERFPTNSKNTKIIIGSYHKTGSVLWSSIWSAYFKPRNISYTDSNHFNKVSQADILKNKCIVIIRNPYEIIMSGVRYHQKTSESWCRVPKLKYNNMSYQEYLQKLSPEDKIIFEMSNTSYSTIMSIYKDIKFRNMSNSVLFIKLEDLYNEQKIPQICTQIKNHLSPMHIQNSELISIMKMKLNNDYHRTNKSNKYTYHSSFKSQHKKKFDQLFPEDIFKVFGYSDDLSLGLK